VAFGNFDFVLDLMSKFTPEPEPAQEEKVKDGERDKITESQYGQDYQGAAAWRELRQQEVESCCR